MYKILRRKQLNDTVVRLDVEAPFIAKKAKAGQFIILRIDERGERMPLTIADTEMLSLGIKNEKVEVDFKEGDMIAVIGGVWSGTAGVVKRIDENRQTVTINVDMFGRETPVELNFTEVKKMN